MRCSLLAPLAASLALGTSCAKREPIPTEKVLVVKVAEAPSITVPDATIVANRVVRRGEAFLLRSTRADLSWNGMFQSRSEKRAGAVEATRRPADRPQFVFTQDLLEAELPTTPWLCARMGVDSIAGDKCTEFLLRTVATPNTLLAHLPCWQQSCPIAELSSGEVTTASVPGLSEVRVITLAGKTLVLAFSNWTRSSDWLGSDVVVMHVSPPLQGAGELSVLELDARKPGEVMVWQGQLETQEDSLRLRGRRSVRNRTTGQETTGTDVDQRWVLGADGKLRSAPAPG